MDETNKLDEVIFHQKLIYLILHVDSVLALRLRISHGLLPSYKSFSLFMPLLPVCHGTEKGGWEESARSLGIRRYIVLQLAYN